MKSIAFVALLVLSIASAFHAESSWAQSGILIAQDNYDAYDPFADYSEFDEATDEEADIYFFKNGRFFTIGLIAGYRVFTDTIGQIYQAAPEFGLSLSYFFDLRLAAQVSYITGDHKFNFAVNGDRYVGSLTVSGFSMDLKYYLNVQNTTKGISEFNPYILGGITQLSRESRNNVDDGTKKDSSMAFQIGVGTEFPMVKNKYHLGIEAIYQYVNFPDEGDYLQTDSGPTNVRMNGDIIRIQAILGFNF
ncbi:MAG: outer membrane beta-barrel protein [Bdellovibrionota bacterium]